MSASAIASNEAPLGRKVRPGRVSETMLLAVSIAWATLLLAIYYERLWPLIALDADLGNLSDFHQQLRAIRLPYIREAALRAMSGIASAALVITAMVASGSVIDRWALPASLSVHERLAVRFGNGAAVLSSLLFLLALTGMYRPVMVRIVIIAMAISGIVMLVRAWQKSAGSNGSVWVRREAPLHLLPWAAVTLLALALAFVTALAPEIEYDALWYHLELPRRWLAAGRLVDDPTEYISLYPGFWELLFGAALSLDGPVGARLLHWSTLGAGGVVAASISTRAFGARSGWIAAAVFVTAPTVFWEATTAYVDLALAMHAGIAVGALWQSTGSEDRRWVVLAGLQFGAACATKHLGLVIAAIAVSCYVLWRLRRDRPMQVARTVMVLGVLAILIPAPWYLRSWLASGNPVFPELYAIFGASPPERWSDATQQALGTFQAQFGAPRTLANIVTLPWDMTMHSWRYGGTLGPFLLLLIPATFAFVWRRQAARWLLASALAYLLVWVSPLSSVQLRFLVPWWLFLSALIAAGIALLADASARIWPPARTLIHVMLAIVAVLNLPPFTPLHERDREGWMRWVTHVVHRVPVEVVSGTASTDAYLRRQIRSYPAWQFLNEHAPADARVLTFFGGDHFYANRTRLWSEATLARQVTWDAADVSSREVVDRLERLGVTHLLVPTRYPNRTHHHDRLAILRSDVLSEFPVVFEDYWAIVYRVDARSRGVETPGRIRPGVPDGRRSPNASTATGSIATSGITGE